LIINWTWILTLPSNENDNPIQMKPTIEQETMLKDYLRKAFLYRETYAEVYDHILSAVNHQKNDDLSFEEAVNQIICEDFGGHKQLALMENKAKKQAVKEGRKKYLHYFIEYFKWPYLLLTFCFTVFIYFTVAQIGFSTIVLQALFAVVLLIPGAVALQRYYKLGYLFGDTKKSIRDDVFYAIAIVPVRLFVWVCIISPLAGNNSIWQQFTPAGITLFFVASSIYMLSLIKLYQEEFKMKAII